MNFEINKYQHINRERYDKHEVQPTHMISLVNIIKAYFRCIKTLTNMNFNESCGYHSMYYLSIYHTIVSIFTDDLRYTCDIIVRFLIIIEMNIITCVC